MNGLGKTVLVFFLFFVALAGVGLSAEKEEKKTERSLPQYPDPAIAEIQRELQNIAQIHQSLQTQHLRQIQEIQRITSQARAHQQLLRNLSVPPKAVKPAGEINTEEILRIEKIRLIQEQAAKNRAALEKFQRRASEKRKETPAKKAPR